MNERNRTLVGAALLVTAFTLFATINPRPVTVAISVVLILWTVGMAVRRLRGQRPNDE